MRTLTRVLSRPPGPTPEGRLSAPLLRDRRTWIAITVFWTAVGIGSWWMEYALSFGSPEGPMTLGRAAARLVYAVLWWGVSVFAVWISDTVTINHYRQYSRFLVHIAIGDVKRPHTGHFGVWGPLTSYRGGKLTPVGFLPGAGDV